MKVLRVLAGIGLAASSCGALIVCTSAGVGHGVQTVLCAVAGVGTGLGLCDALDTIKSMRKGQ